MLVEEVVEASLHDAHADHDVTHANGSTSHTQEERQDMLLDVLARQLREKDALIAKLMDERAERRPRPEFIDIGWAAFNVEAIEGVGIWAEQNRPGEPVDPECPRLRVFGESFTITEEVLWFLQQELGIASGETDTHDKFAALTDENSCLNRAMISEPIFILRAQDELAGDLVRLWAERAEERGCTPAKVAEARLVAEMMDKYPVHKTPD